MRTILSILTLLFTGYLHAQLYVSPGGAMEITNGAMVTVKDMDAENQGSISHSGDLEVTGNIINSGTWVCNSSFPSRISLTLNWINNISFNPGVGRVEFNGGNQGIGGSRESVFYKLILNGISGNSKTMFANASCLDSLYLKNVELATNGNRFYLRNASIPVQRGTGYISTNKNGAVKTLFPAAYTGNALVPLGFGTSAKKFKPVYIVNPRKDSFEFTLFGFSPDLEKRSSTALQDSLCSINDNYYFRIQTFATPLFYGITKDIDDEELYTKLARWNLIRWDKISRSTPTALISSSNLALNGQEALTNEYIAQGHERPYIDAGPDVKISIGPTVRLRATGYIPTGANITWDPSAGLSCPNCLNPVVSPMAMPGIYTITVSNGPNCSASDSTEVIQDGNYGHLVPNAFSPNDDDLNDSFGPVMLPGDKLLKIEIFNRWGEKLYQGTENWDGTYMGEPVPQGAYMYTIYILRQGKRYFNLAGTLTIVK